MDVKFLPYLYTFTATINKMYLDKLGWLLEDSMYQKVLSLEY